MRSFAAKTSDTRKTEVMNSLIINITAKANVSKRLQYVSCIVCFGRDIYYKTSDSLLKHFAALLVIAMQILPEIPANFHFGHFHREGCRISSISVAWIHKRLGFLLKTCNYFLCLNGILHLFVTRRCYFVAIIRHTKSFPHPTSA